jgi:hypothetical protein
MVAAYEAQFQTPPHLAFIRAPSCLVLSRPFPASQISIARNQRTNGNQNHIEIKTDTRIETEDDLRRKNIDTDVGLGRVLRLVNNLINVTSIHRGRMIKPKSPRHSQDLRTMTRPRQDKTGRREKEKSGRLVTILRSQRNSMLTSVEIT